MTLPDLFLISRSTSTPFYIWAAPIYNPIFSPKVGQLLIFVFLMMIVIRQVWDSISLWFWITFPWWLLILNIFNASVVHLYILWKMSFEAHHPFLNWDCFLYWVVQILCIFWILTIYQRDCLQISSPVQWAAFSFC